jgi:hypothetical protein
LAGRFIGGSGGLLIGVALLRGGGIATSNFLRRRFGHSSCAGLHPFPRLIPHPPIGRILAQHLLRDRLGLGARSDVDGLTLTVLKVAALVENFGESALGIDRSACSSFTVSASETSAEATRPATDLLE